MKHIINLFKHFTGRSIAVLTSLLLVLLLFYSASYADNTNLSDISGTPFYGPVTEIEKAGIIKGYPDGTFRPFRTLTRAEAATMVYRAYGSTSLALESPFYFYDVAADMWAAPFINYCAGAGIINGYPDGSFRPDSQVTYNEIITLIVRARGLDTGDLAWPDGCIQAARSDGMLDSLYEVSMPGSGNVPANRGNTALLIASGSEYNTSAAQETTEDVLADPDMSCICCGLLSCAENRNDRLDSLCGWGRFLMGSTTYDVLSEKSQPGLFSGYNPAYGLLRMHIENGRAVSVRKITEACMPDQPCGLLSPAGSDPELTEFCRVISADSGSLTWQISSTQQGTIPLNSRTVCYAIGLRDSAVAASSIPVSEIGPDDMAAVYSVEGKGNADVVLAVHPADTADILHATDNKNVMYMG